MAQMREVLIAAYLDYFNNYLSISKYACDNGLEDFDALALINLGREIYNSAHPEA